MSQDFFALKYHKVITTLSNTGNMLNKFMENPKLCSHGSIDGNVKAPYSKSSN